MWSDTSWTPPEKFGMVEPGLYRSAFPTTASHEYLKLLGLRTVVNLSQELPMRAVISAVDDLGAELLNLGLQVWTRPCQPPISHELVKEALQVVLDHHRQPLLLISASGTHEVGTLVGCLRRLQQWNLASVLDEYRSYASPSPRISCEQFIELWDMDLLELPLRPPAWLELQEQMLTSDGAAWLELQQFAQGEGGCERTGRGVEGAHARSIRAYFRVSGPLASRGTFTTIVNEDDD